MRYDFRHRFHLPLSQVGEEIPWDEAVDLVEQLQLDMGSRLFMSMMGWSYPMSRADFAGAVLTSRVANALQAQDAKPFPWEWPWPDTPPADAATDEERAQAKTVLKAHSAFGQIRT